MMTYEEKIAELSDLLDAVNKHIEAWPKPVELMAERARLEDEIISVYYAQRTAEMRDITERVAAMVQVRWQTAHESEDAAEWAWRWNRLGATLGGMHAGVNHFGELDAEEWDEFIDCYRLLKNIALHHYLEI
jgi:hypothetical protein